MRSLPALGAIGLAVITSGPAAAQTIRSSAGDVAVATIAKGLDHPWGFAFLPDDRILVTERAGRMRVVAGDGKLSPPLAGVPRVFAAGQGGLLDVALARGYARSGAVFFCYAEPANGGARTTLARARLVLEGAPRLDDPKPIFRQEGPLSSSNHFGCRIVFARLIPGSDNTGMLSKYRKRFAFFHWQFFQLTADPFIEDQRDDGVYFIA